MGLIFVFPLVLLIFFGSQIYWILWVRRQVRRRVAGRGARWATGLVLLALYVFLFVFNMGLLGRRATATSLTLVDAVLGAPFQWWIASSMVAFLVVLALWLVKAPLRIATWIRRRPHRPAEPAALESAPRRVFLERAAGAALAAPFVAGTYGLFYGRLNLDTPTQGIHLARLPKAFHGFRIAQLSDIHIGPFMTGEEIRKYVRIANSLRPDLIVLTGDFVTWDPSTQQAVVSALSGLKAPYGVYGCLGNHDAWAKVEDSITFLFKQAGIRILRYEQVPIVSHGESFNLVGVDYQHRPHGRREIFQLSDYLQGCEKFVRSETANILLSHNPDSFDRAAELGFDLSLAGHTHGGQVALEFISPEIAPCRMVTPYVSGWFQKPGGQLYVNRGIGTIGVPIRLGAPPEITLYELTRPA